jgi:hypothetical protein
VLHAVQQGDRQLVDILPDDDGVGHDPRLPIITFESDGTEFAGAATIRIGIILDDWPHSHSLDVYADTNGRKFVVNQFTDGYQQQVQAARLDNGNVFVAWSDFNPGQAPRPDDGSWSSIRGRLLSPDGGFLTDEFLVNTTVDGSQSCLHVQALADGRFMVFWQDYPIDVAPGLSGDIRAQIFDANARKLGSETVVNSEAFGKQAYAKFHELADGRLIVFWGDESGRGADESGSGIKAQIFDDQGAKVGDEFSVNTTTEGDQRPAFIDDRPGGGFALSWGMYGVGTFLQLFDAYGVKEGSEVFFPSALGRIEWTGRDSFNFVERTWIGDGDDTAVYATEYILRDLDIAKPTDADDTIAGSHLGDSIAGLAGNDTLMGGAERLPSGDDRFDGGQGSDMMIGGDGDDVYRIDCLSDRVIEAAGQGDDKIFSSACAVALSDNIEAGAVIGALSLALTGNVLDNRLNGNAAGNVIAGLSGDDRVKGGDGDDRIAGGDGDDWIDGGLGDDTTVGGAGNDTYRTPLKTSGQMAADLIPSCLRADGGSDGTQACTAGVVRS